MPNQKPPPAAADRVLVKLRPTAALRAAESRADLRPLHEPPPGAASPFGLSPEPQWFVADLRDSGPTPWDLAHTRVADQLGVDGSDVLFVEPDIIHTIFRDGDQAPDEAMFAAGIDCSKQIEQTEENGQVPGPGYAWHLEDSHSQLGTARNHVPFTDPHRTCIAHIDTGYQPDHVTKPTGVQGHLERNFIKRDGTPDDASDPNNRAFLVDNSGHGTGTLGILAGAPAPEYGSIPIGGAPDVHVVPLRVADRVVLFYSSVFARALKYATDIGCDVVSMSMGGLPTRSWAEEVSRAYEEGVCVVTAAGNNFGRLPTVNVVYPARFARVIAACGVMANDTPYFGLTNREMQGNHGPQSVMGSALSAYTPNIPWAIYGCRTKLRLNGGGTSSATPQIAAAAALWYEKYKSVLPRNWRRVEAVRNALFTSARQVPAVHRPKLGRGILQAADALEIQPDLTLPKMPADTHYFAFLRVLTGLGMVEIPPREEMFNLEFMQRWLLNEELQEIVPDPDAVDRLSDAKMRKLMEALIEDHGASLALRRHMAERYPVLAGKHPPRTPPAEDVVVSLKEKTFEDQPALRDPANRRLRVFAVDPSLSGSLETAGINEVTLSIRWEDLQAGPAGEYLSVQDVDPSGEEHAGVNLNDPRLLARDGWAPSEGNAQFHQQMVYAVVMKTIEHFERALGRPVLWRPKRSARQRQGEGTYTQQLTIRPHALRQANAYYSPQEVALLFGYFEAPDHDPGRLVPGSRIYTVLSHDIIVHEATHAVLDGMQRHFNEPSNPDVLAFHEGFADIVALMQHFTIPELLEAEIARTRGDIEAESILGSLAVQFGRALGRGGALREAIGRMEGGVWKRLPADPTELQKRLAPHARGAILVAAVFDAFIAIYKTRTVDLLRIYTGGTGILPSGAIHPDLVQRLAGEAARAAGHVLNMCIRALDYLPPVDVTFFEYLRALITADYDLVREDRYNYRVAFVEAFRQRGIYPANLGQAGSGVPRSLSVQTLRWQGLDQVTLAARAEDELTAADVEAMKEQYKEIVEGLKRYADACFYLENREKLWEATNDARDKLATLLKRAFKAVPALAAQLGVDARKAFEVQELRRAMRIAPDGRHIPQIVVSFTQEVTVGATADTPRFTFRGGSTLVVDLTTADVKYRIVKNIDSTRRQERTADFVRHIAADPLRALFLAPDRREPFAALHALAEDGT